MRLIKFAFIAVSLFAFAGCPQVSEAQADRNAAPPAPSPTTINVAVKFAYPIGKTEFLTQAKDKKDDWYNALDFGADDHLGEDWNKNSGGDTDCGEKVFAVADGRIVYAADAGPGWGNVVIIEHALSGGGKVQSLYGHLRKIFKTSGEVKFREQIGEIGNADGKYLCHLHFEIRQETCPMWNRAGGGYSADNQGWLDPSDFIDKNR
ncbi:MAG TPA: M23 family metallopeptidase [Pyrinomonadaceae bacterium]|jgi:murein DD-endopeptidase MepM/ murein hydrolase activator NlpD